MNYDELDLGKEFSVRTKALMKIRKITREKMSEKLGIATSTFANYVRDYEPISPPLTRAIEISEILEVPLEYLCGLNETREHKLGKNKADVILENLYYAIMDANLDFQFVPSSDNKNFKVVIESSNEIVVKFLFSVGRNADVSEVKKIASMYKKYQSRDGVLVGEEYLKEEYIYGDFEKEDMIDYPEESMELIEDRKKEWEQKKGNQN